jgi:peptide/nickel transport system substrate-binding protein
LSVRARAAAVVGNTKTLTYVPQANLTSLDPVWTTALVTRNCAAMIFETLYGRDEKLNPKPQMVEGHQVENDGLRWTMRLRDGLLFHDGTPVLARDCVASLLRWMKRDPISISDRLDAGAPDDRTFFPAEQAVSILASALAKTHRHPDHAGTSGEDRPVQADPRSPSGPFHFVTSEYVANRRCSPNLTATIHGPSPPALPPAASLFARVEWRVPTQPPRLMLWRRDRLAGPPRPTAPMLRKTSGVTIGRDIYAFPACSRIQLQGPISIRCAPRHAGRYRPGRCDDGGNGRQATCSRAGRFFLPGTRRRTMLAWMRTRTPHTDDVKAMLKEAGYGGERVVLMHRPTRRFTTR